MRSSEPEQLAHRHAIPRANVDNFALLSRLALFSSVTCKFACFV